MQTQGVKSNPNNLCVLLEGKIHMSFVLQPWGFCHSLTLAVLVCVAAEHLSHSWEAAGMSWLCSRPDPGQQSPSEMGTMFQAETKREFFFQASAQVILET